MIATAMKACETNSPSPAASWLKFQGGKLYAYGGTFCVQIPCAVDLECAFIPSALLAFYRKERKGVSFTLKDDKMIVREGRERATIKTLPIADMPLIDVLKTPTKVKRFLPKKALKAMLGCIDPAEPRHCLQGMCIRNGLAIGTDGKILLAISTKLDKDITCVVPTETLKFLASLDEDVCAIASDNLHIKFYLPSGMTVCSRTMLADEYPDIRHLIRLDSMDEVTLHPDMHDEIKGLKCDKIEVTNYAVTFSMGNDTSFGQINLDSGSKEFRFTVNRAYFELLLSLCTTDKIHIAAGRNRMMVDGGKFFKMTVAMMQPMRELSDEEIDKEVPF